jgi:hypothetical protein
MAYARQESVIFLWVTTPVSHLVRNKRKQL